MQQVAMQRHVRSIRGKFGEWLDEQRRLREIAQIKQHREQTLQREQRKEEHRLRAAAAQEIRRRADEARVAEKERRAVLRAELHRQKESIRTAARREWLSALNYCLHVGLEWRKSPIELKNRRFALDEESARVYPQYDGHN